MTSKKYETVSLDTFEVSVYGPEVYVSAEGTQSGGNRKQPCKVFGSRRLTTDEVVKLYNELTECIHHPGSGIELFKADVARALTYQELEARVRR